MTDEDTTGSGERAGILRLPPEVFEEVANAIDRSDLPNLRLVNREVESKIWRVYRTRLFSSIAILLCSEEALYKLLAITRSERFGPYIRKLKLCLNEVYDERLDKTERFSAEHQNTIRESPLDSLLLTSVFCYLRRYGKSLDIDITSMHACDEPVMGFRRFESTTHIRFKQWLCCIQCYINEACSIVMRAIRSSQLNVKALAISSRYEEEIIAWDRWSWSMDQEGALFDNLSIVFTTVASLHLVSYNTSGDFDKNTARAIVATFSDSKVLKKLSFHPYPTRQFEQGTPYHPDGNEELGEALMQARLPAVEHLALSGLLLNFTAFANFLRRHPKMLKIELRHVMFRKAPVKTNSYDDEDGGQAEILAEELGSFSSGAHISVKRCRSFTRKS
ncbi:hypothetical protein Tdes44962_MAKER05564 [Teratosphaeria destructans]|uniref:F-box domain-containing protein n=1 Tax=Teratosphaeria destructans TaxID=418781 RepID=A0A9W7SK71_9PEZI|nr:hypothetical protein Tdes44962_MAKER05564 [Teratosphaeria destructans]